MGVVPDLDQAFSIARNASLKAGEKLCRIRSEGSFESSYKGLRNLVTTADLAAEAIILEAVRKNFPSHTILSEEHSPHVQDTALKHGPLWIVDPLDGTVNYAHGLPQVAVSVAFAFDGIVQFGIVHAPFQGETFHARRGQGASVNDTPIRVSACSELTQALVATGFPYDRSDIELLVARVRSVLAHCQDIRRIGAGSLDICWVGAGRLDAFYETLEAWDIAAARLIAHEAGALVGNMGEDSTAFPPDLNGRDLLVATPSLYEQLEGILRA